MSYHGVIIEESLEDKSIISTLRIVQTDIETVTPDHKTPWVQQWTLHTVEIGEKDAETVAKTISRALDKNHAWYADFKNDTHHFVIFRDRFFKIDRSQQNDYHQVVQYGLSLGIPAYQLDFSPTVDEWKRAQT